MECALGPRPLSLNRALAVTTLLVFFTYLGPCSPSSAYYLLPSLYSLLAMCPTSPFSIAAMVGLILAAVLALVLSYAYLSLLLLPLSLHCLGISSVD